MFHPSKLLSLVIFVFFAAIVAFAQNNPTALLVGPLVPPSVAPGSPDLTLTINGTGFEPGSVVDWNGKALTTTFVSGLQVKATVPASDLASSGTASITVVNPSPAGASNILYFTVHAPISNLTYTSFPVDAGDAPSVVGA